MKLIDKINYLIASSKLKIVHLVLHPHGIAPTFLKLDSWSLGAGFIPIISTMGINKEKERKIIRKKLGFIHTKRFKFF